MALKMWGNHRHATTSTHAQNSQLLRIITALVQWPALVRRLLHETLRAERALRLHIKTALVVDGLSIALHDAREED